MIHSRGVYEVEYVNNTPKILVKKFRQRLRKWLSINTVRKDVTTSARQLVQKRKIAYDQLTIFNQVLVSYHAQGITSRNNIHTRPLSAPHFYLDVFIIVLLMKIETVLLWKMCFTMKYNRHCVSLIMGHRALYGVPFQAS